MMPVCKTIDGSVHTYVFLKNRDSRTAFFVVPDQNPAAFCGCLGSNADPSQEHAGGGSTGERHGICPSCVRSCPDASCLMLEYIGNTSSITKNSHKTISILSEPC